VYSLRYLGVEQFIGDPSDSFTPWGCQHATTARKRARFMALRTELSIEVIANDRVLYVVRPDGSLTPPAGASVVEREKCRSDEGTCFCTPCRAARREGS
jgi:hypothetical protein